MNRHCLVVLMCGCALPALLAQDVTPRDTSGVAQVRRMEAARRDALLRNDVAALDTMLAADLTAVYSLYPGRVLSRTEELAGNQGATRRVLSWEPRDETVRVFGNVGLVTAVAEISDSLRGAKRRLVMQYTHVWVRRHERWQLVHRHTNRVATLEGPPPPPLNPQPDGS